MHFPNDKGILVYFQNVSFSYDEHANEIMPILSYNSVSQ
jgi:hypothetical protein